MSIFEKREKPGLKAPISLTPEEENKIWLANTTQKLLKRGLLPQNKPQPPQNRNEAAIRQSVGQYIRVHIDKKE